MADLPFNLTASQWVAITTRLSGTTNSQPFRCRCGCGVLAGAGRRTKGAGQRLGRHLRGLPGRHASFCQSDGQATERADANPDQDRLTMAVPRLRMFAGPNGSGKSTIKSVVPEMDASNRQIVAQMKNTTRPTNAATPAGVGLVSPGIRECRCAQSPANGSNPSGMKNHAPERSTGEPGGFIHQPGRFIHQPGGFPAISRGSRRATPTPPVHRPQHIRIPEGCQP